MLIPLVHYEAEIWNSCTDEHDALDQEARKTWAKVLGFSPYMNMTVLRAEAGALSMKGQRDIQSLACLNRVLNMDPTRLTQQVMTIRPTGRGRPCPSCSRNTT